MEPIKKLEDIVKTVKSKEKKKVAVAYGQDSHTILAIYEAVKEGLVNAIVTGDEAKIIEICKKEGVDPSNFEIINEPNELKAIEHAIELVREKKANVLMKGLCSTASYMRGILDKEKGLLPEGALLSHATIIESENYHKLLIGSDVAVLLQPDLSQKQKIIEYTVNIAHKLGIEIPKVAIIAAVETVNLKMQATIDGAILSKMNERGQIKGCIVDGPLAVDVAVSKEAVDIKGLKSSIDGDADILIFPNIETGNAFYKALTKLGKSELAAVVVGTMQPCVLTSRGDTEKSKFYSIALAALVSE